jgi:DNA-binding SARP family transcriptional activator
MSVQPPGVCLGLLDVFSLRCGTEHVQLPTTAQRLLAFLALHRQPQPRAHVAAALWIDSTTDRAGGSLRSVLWRLGRIHRRGLVAGGDELRLADGVDVDVHRAWREASRLLDGEPGDRVTTEELAHDILPDWDEEWIRPERDRFRQVRLHALETLSRRLAGEHRYGDAVGAALIAVEGDPLRESAHRALIGAYLAEGNRGEALHHYHACHRLFQDRLGLPPSRELGELIDQALARR